ncbi:hypothetical protein GCM10010919_30850 [Alishewanella longhuensis]|uniref:GGDEF domain-containing protein n=1 Tax=Alishewanella longhuensis TaxID=1091037 RepID=A0ABQ3L2D5_9ALTE|nr:GGDEF domain-containing phosphodiesterase [Alishewanella longhuensis]GHG76184.1 hypothetical protein GCM10010919_30850 [Alishewanella longhuensis]
MAQHFGLLFTVALLSAPPAFANSKTFVEGAFLFTSIILCLVILALSLALYSLGRRQQKLQRLRASFNELLSETQGVIAVLDRNLSLQNGSSSLKRFLKHEESTTVSAPLNLFADATANESINYRIKHHLRTDGSWNGTAWLYNGQSSEAFQLSIQAIQPDKLRAPVYLLYGQNISQLRRENEQQLQQQLRDSDTLLPNKKLFEEHLSMTIQSCDDHYPATAVMYIQLTPIFPEYPVAAPPDFNQLAMQVAIRLQQALPFKVLLARYQHDAFTVLVPPHLCNENSTIYVNQLAHKVLACFDQQEADNLSRALNVFIGISISPNDGLDAESIIKSAEKAAEKAAVQGKNSLCFADSASQFQAPDYLALEAELERSAKQGEFEVYYQPQMSISSNRIIGFEALLRWPSPFRGMLPPPTFMPLVEETGLIIRLDRLVFRKACEQVKLWQKEGLMRGRLALNISNQQFEQADFLSFMATVLEEHEVNAHLFELELPESIFNHPTIWLRERLHSLVRMGFKLILDNFGEGIASLTQLRQYPLHGVKLSSSLTKAIDQQEQQRNICATLIRLTGYLELNVAATNIETEKQAYLLHIMGCDSQQGYHFSKAVPASEIGRLLLREASLLKIKAVNE